MRRILAVLAASLTGTPCLAAGVGFIFDFQPGSILISPDADRFNVSQFTVSGYDWESGVVRGYYESEEVGPVSSLPTLRAGLGIDAGVAYVDLTGGVGYLLNAALRAPVFRADAALRLKLGRIVTLGPHCGLIHVEAPEWLGQADLEFSDSDGVMGGIDFSVGRTISFLLSIDYVRAKFDVKVKNEWMIEDNGEERTSGTLDMSGVAIQTGIMGRF
ncbi:MAG: hypothetical protein HZB55_15670 [Deltaproteobacteria bacterium]|nr:hypothetical protein [Deltaproteobacteria bacterium]